MAFDQNSMPQDLRPVNVVGTLAEEQPRIVPASISASSTGRNVEGFYAGSPSSVPVYYHLPVSDSSSVRFGGYGAAAAAAAPVWTPRMPVAMGHAAGVNPAVGFCYGPSFGNRVGVSAVDHQVSSSDVVAGVGYTPNLVVRAGGGVCLDQGTPDSAAAAGVGLGAGMGYSPNLVVRTAGGVCLDQGSPDSAAAAGFGFGAGMGYSPNLAVQAGGVCLDQESPDSAAAAGFAFGAGLADRESGNEMEQGSFDARAGFGSKPCLGNTSSGSAAEHASEDGGDDSVSGKKVKFLCSFGGKILPRPSDNALRYVGGHTRIISVRRDVSYSELLQKMINAYGRPVVIKYQLPDEDLDALVSVSCQDDVDNMMDEYEKLVERSGDCSVKLRVFLFLASELDPSGVVQFRNMHDSGQKYVDAVNEVGDAVGGSGITRRESITSAASTQNSDFSGSEAVDNAGFPQGDIGGPPLINKVPTEGNSSSSQDASPRLVCVDPSATINPDSSVIPLTTAVPVYGATPTLSSQPEVKIENSVSPSTPQRPAEIPPPAFYVQAFVDPRRQEAIKKTDFAPLPQMGSANFQMLRPVGFIQPQFHDHTASTSSHHFVPAMHMRMPPSSTHIAVRPAMVQPPIQPQQTLLEHHPNDSAFGPRAVQLPVDQSYAGYHSKVPRAFVGGGYYLNQLPASNRVVYSDGSLPSQQGISPESSPRLEDCYMCHKQLPHQHSDTLVQNKRDVLASPVSDASSGCHSFQLEEHIRAQPLNRIIVSRPLEISTGEQGIGVQPKITSHMDHHVATPQSEAATTPHKLEAQRENEGTVSLEADNTDEPRKTVPQGTSRLEGFVQPPYGIGVGAIPHSLLETKAQQPLFTTRPLQENEMCVPGKLGNYDPIGSVVNQGVMGITSEMCSPYGAYIGGYPDSLQETFVPQHLMQNQHQVEEDSRMNRPRASDALSSANIATQNSDWNESSRDSGSAGDVMSAGNNTVDCLRAVNGRMENLNICPPESLLNSDQVRTSADEHRVGGVFNSNPQQNVEREIILENDINLSNVVLEASQSKPTDMPAFTSQEVFSVHNVCPADSYEMAQVPDLGISGTFSQTVPGGRPQESTNRYFDPALSVIEPTFIMNKVPATTEHMEDASQILPDMIRNDLDFMASSGGAAPSVLPSSQINAVQNSSDSLFSNQDPWNLRFDTPFPPPKPNKIATKKEFVDARDPLVDISTGEAQPDDRVSQQSSNMSSAEDNIKQQLQAVAEGVAASVFQPATVSNADSSLSNINELVNVPNLDQGASYTDADMQLKAEVEDSNRTKPEKANFGFPISDGIGRLQIIKNSDLEELRELGSGTFGTVYHGKWRGTDVAIKRINDRCFVGKASEQERMRDDFWNEAIKLAELHHPNVLAFYGVVLDGPGGSVATVTEYMINGSLRNVLHKSERGLDKRKRLLIAMDVAFGMEYLHGKNIVHFDLKSDNLLVNLRDPQRPICKVGDLGLSKVKCQTLISGGVRGTLPWMAPELLNGSSSLVSEKVDVFSFGIVMWELLTGEEPYADLHYGAIIGGIVSNTLRPQVPESCDLEWRALMERCWLAEPSERPGFTEIVNEFRSMAAKLPPKVQNAAQHAATTHPHVQK